MKEKKELKRSFRFSQTAETIINGFNGKNMQEKFDNLVRSVDDVRTITAKVEKLNKKVAAKQAELYEIDILLQKKNAMASELDRLTEMTLNYRIEVNNRKEKKEN